MWNLSQWIVSSYFDYQRNGGHANSASDGSRGDQRGRQGALDAGQNAETITISLVSA